MNTHKLFHNGNLKFEFRITLSYLIFGFLWILFSDEVLDFLVDSQKLLTKFQTYKGAFFILVTSIFLFLLVKRHMQSLQLAESRLIESEYHYKALFVKSPSIIILVNPANGLIEDANPSACKFYGWTHHEFCSKYIYDFNIQNKDEVSNRLHSVEAKIQDHFVTRHRLSGGEIKDVEVFSSPIHLGNKTLIYSNIHDITEQKYIEEELRKLSKAVEQSPVAIYITNPDGIIEYVNPEVTQLTGYTAEELINNKSGIFNVGEYPQFDNEAFWQIIKSGKVWSGEFHTMKKNGNHYWESATISPIFDTEGNISHFLSINENITDRKLSEIALNKSEELLHKFASHLQNVREEEKVALSREIHDELGQILVALKIDMGLLKNKIARLNVPNESKDIMDKFESLVNLIDRTIKTSRRIMSGLRPELLEINGFAGAVKSYLREFEDRHKIKCEYISGISVIEMSSQQSLVLFRILQESLTNIAKHSRATLVKIYFGIETNRLILQIIDNGIGFDIYNSGRQDSYGLIGMKERVVLLGGELMIESEIGNGTSVRVVIPWNIN